MDGSVSKKNKILFISHSARLYGAEKSLLLLLKYIDRERFDPIVVVPKDGPFVKELSLLKIKFYKVNCPWWIRSRMKIWFFILKIFYNLLMETYATVSLIRIIFMEKPDLIYTNSMVILSGAIAARFTKKPHIWHVHEIIKGYRDWQAVLPKQFFIDLVSNFSYRIIAASRASANQFGESRISKVAVIPNAVDFENFFGNKTAQNANLGLKKEDWPVVFIGMLSAIKAPDVAIKAVSFVKNICPNIKLLIVGEGDSAYSNFLKKLVQDLNLSGLVSFLGWRDDICRILTQCNALVISSRSESFPFVALEAMAAAVPVVGTDVGGLKEIIVDSETGFLVPSDNPQAISSAISWLYNNDEDRKEMSRKAKDRVYAEFGVEKYLKNIEKILIVS